MFHTEMYFATRVQARVRLRKAGTSKADTDLLLEMSNSDLDGMLTAAATAANVTVPSELLQPLPGVVAAGGTIIAAIIAFFQSAAGQQLMAALIQLLIGLIPKS